MEPLKHNNNKTGFNRPELLVVKHGIKAPQREELNELIKKFAPVLTIHPNEEYTPIAVEGFLKNAMVINSLTKTKLPATGRSLFEAALIRDKFYLCPGEGYVTPVEKPKTYVCVYAHDETYTDLQYWFLFSHAGPASARVKWLIDVTIKGYDGKIELDPLGKIGGNWETIIVRMNNSAREAEQVFFSSGRKGSWVDMDKTQNICSRVGVYVSKNSHSFYPAQGFNTVEKIKFNSYSSELEFSIQDETAAGRTFDFSESWELISAAYLGKNKPIEPFWFNCQYPWGNPNPDYLTVPALKRMIPATFGKSLDFLLSKDLLDEVVNYLLVYFREESAYKTLGPKFRHAGVVE